MIKVPKLGDIAESKKVYSTDLVQMFAKISGDNNPIHLDETFSSQNIFGRPIVHGMLVASQISELIANKLPGPGSIYLSQTLKFRSPVYHNDLITCTIKITSVRIEKKTFELTTICYNQNNNIVIEGIALIKIL